MSRRNHTSTANALEINFRCASEVYLPDQTARNRLNDGCTRARRPARSQVLTEKHLAVRINFAPEHQNRHLRHWRPVLFKDDNISTDSTNDRPARVWRRQGERYAACNIVEGDRYDGGLVVALYEISLDGRTVLYGLVRAGITVAIHRSDILEPIVRPFAGVIGDAFILIQDNARAQTVLVSMTFLDVEGISVMNWLTMSP